MSVDPLNELLEYQQHVRSSRCIGMQRQGKDEPVVLSVEVLEVLLPQLLSIVIPCCLKCGLIELTLRVTSASTKPCELAAPLMNM
jgi:hypothetical protein